MHVAFISAFVSLYTVHFFWEYQEQTKVISLHVAEEHNIYNWTSWYKRGGGQGHFRDPWLAIFMPCESWFVKNRFVNRDCSVFREPWMQNYISW